MGLSLLLHGRRFLCALGLVGLSLCGAVSAAGNVLCCVDAAGKQACGDILPAACYGRAYREINASGVVVRQVEAPLSADEQRQRVTAEQARQKREMVLREQQRADRALLKTYSSVEDIAAWQQRAQAPVEAAVLTAERQLSVLRERYHQYSTEAAHYRNTVVPTALAKQLQDTERDIQLQQSVLLTRQKELAMLQAKYAQDRQRYLELTGSRADAGERRLQP